MTLSTLFAIGAAVVVLSSRVETNITPAHVEHPIANGKTNGMDLVVGDFVLLSVTVPLKTNITLYSTLGTVTCQTNHVYMWEADLDGWETNKATCYEHRIEIDCLTNIIGTVSTNWTIGATK